MRGVPVHAGFVAALAGPETGVQPNVAVGRGAWKKKEPMGVVRPLMVEKALSFGIVDWVGSLAFATTNLIFPCGCMTIVIRRRSWGGIQGRREIPERTG